MAQNASDLLPSASGTPVCGKRSSGAGGQNVSEDWTRVGKRQILSIGGRKRHRHHDDDDDGDDDELLAGDVAAVGDGSESDEDDLGRTSAIKERKRRAQPTTATSTAIAGAAASGRANDGASGDVPFGGSTVQSKKKKKGKKERINGGKVDVGASTEITNKTDVPTIAETDVVDDVVVDDAGNRDDEPGIEVGTSDKKKRWKKKVRSRQKNIRKDHRAAADRPPHLVSGGGRPLTEATRQRMGMDTTTTNKDSSEAKSFATKSMFDSGQWVGDVDATGHVAGGIVKDNSSSGRKRKKAALTKVGDCIVDGEITSEQRSDERTLKMNVEGVSSDRKKGANQKRKFKNIIVG